MRRSGQTGLTLILVPAFLFGLSGPSARSQEAIAQGRRIGTAMTPGVPDARRDLAVDRTATQAETPDPPSPTMAEPSPAEISAMMSGPITPIDLGTALRLAGVQNPDILVARQRVVESVALRQFAAVQILPTLNAGLNYDAHTGVLQQSNGNILSVNRTALFVGSGSNAIAAGTVNIPGVLLTGNVAAGIYAWLGTRQEVVAREATAVAVRNQTFLDVTLAYCELLRAEGRRAIAYQSHEEAAQIANLTASYAATGEGRAADANRAAAERAVREADLRREEGEVLAASARLAQLLNLDPSMRLHPTDAWAVPQELVPSPMPVGELIAIAMLQRPELAERRAVIRQALLALEGAKVLPFSPTVILGFSGGGFGGGSNLILPVFGGFGGRADFDAVAWWTLQNCGVGNLALINIARARLQRTRYEQISVLNRVREEVAESYAISHARYAQIVSTELAVGSGKGAFEKDFARITARAERDVLPIELLNSFRLLARSRYEYLDSIIDYNQAQFELYVALGQPPVPMLSRPVPTEGIAPTRVEASAPAPELLNGDGAAGGLGDAADEPAAMAAPAAAVLPVGDAAPVPTTPNGPSR